MSDESHHRRVQRQFGAHAQQYRASASHARGASLDRLIMVTEPQPQWLVLDIATGAGHAAAALAPRVQTVIASDMTPSMLDQAASVRRERELGNMILVRESAEALAYRPAVFDLVTCRVAAHHFADPNRFVTQCARVLKPGGRLVIIDNIVPEDADIAAWINRFERQRDPSHCRCLSQVDWRNLFERQSLRPTHAEVHDKWFGLDPWLRRAGASPREIERLGRDLLHAPEGVRAFLKPRSRPGSIELALQEALLVAQRPLQ